MKENILKVLLEIRPDFDFLKSPNFIEDGGLDSFDLISLVMALDREFAISIPGIQIIPENFLSVEAIANVVKNCTKN